MPLPKRSSHKIEFLIPGSPTDAFCSQIAFFRMSLDALGEQGLRARVVAVFGADVVGALPARWAVHFERIEVAWADPEEYRKLSYHATVLRRYQLLDPEADLCCLCDADTVLLRPIPLAFLEEIEQRPTLNGVVAHLPFPIDRDSRGADGQPGLFPGMAPGLAWERLAAIFLGHPISRPLHYTLRGRGEDDRAPFYINYGFLAGTPRLLGRLHPRLLELHQPIAEILGNVFCGQVAVALAVEQAEKLPWRALPMRYNFPNDRDADRLYPEELEQVIVMHYLRTDHFDRHRIFSERAAFHEFLALDLVGSDRVFQDHVRRVTGGDFPFATS